MFVDMRRGVNKGNFCYTQRHATASVINKGMQITDVENKLYSVCIYFSIHCKLPVVSDGGVIESRVPTDP